MTIEKIDETTYNKGRGQGQDVTPRTASAQVADPDRPFTDHGQRWFGDVAFPAEPDDMYASALAHGAPRRILDAIRNLPEKTYRHPDELPDLYELAGIEAPTPPERQRNE